jgi:hypothetical protein
MMPYGRRPLGDKKIDFHRIYENIIKPSIRNFAVNGDKASITVIEEGLKTPTAVEPAGDTIWVAERATEQGSVDSDAKMVETDW